MKEITTTELQQKLENGETLHMVDVREEDEVATGIIPGAIHIPLGELPERFKETQSINALRLHLPFRRTQRTCSRIFGSTRVRRDKHGGWHVGLARRY